MLCHLSYTMTHNMEIKQANLLPKADCSQRCMSVGSEDVGFILKEVRHQSWTLTFRVTLTQTFSITSNKWVTLLMLAVPFRQRRTYSTPELLLKVCRKGRSLTVKANAHHFQCSRANLETWRRFKPIPIRRSFSISLFQYKCVEHFPRAVESKSNCRRKIFASMTGLK